MRAVLAFIAFVSTGCGSGTGDAQHDAAVDATAPRCGVVTPSGGLPSHSATVAFEATVEGLDIGAISGYPLDALTQGDSVRVFGRFRSFTVSPSNEVTMGPWYPTNAEGDTSEVLEAARGSQSFGVVMNFSNGDIRFCVVDEVGEVVDCKPLALSAGSAGPKVAFDGAAYQVADVRDGIVHRWRFDEAANPLGEDDLWSATPYEYGLFSLRTFDTQPIAISRDRHDGPTCSTLRLQNADTPAGVDLLPPDFEVAGVPESAQVGNVAQVFYTGVCTVGGLQPCSPAPDSDERVTFSARIENGSLSGISPVPAGTQGRFEVFVDGTDVMVGHLWGPDVRIEGFGADGTMTVSPVVVDLTTDLPGSIVQDLHGIAAFGPRDYLIAYTADTVEGPKVRIARVQLTPI